MYTLGLNAAFHDSSAVLMHDGRLVAAAEEERFTRIKHAKRPEPFTAWELPFHAIDYCLREGGLTLNDVDHVAYAFDPACLVEGAMPSSVTLPIAGNDGAFGEGSSWDALFLAYTAGAERQLRGGAPHHLRERFMIGGGAPRYRWHFVPHHAAHEASAYLAAPAEQAAVMTLDGRGEQATTTLGVFDGRVHRRLEEVRMPHSLGLLYEAITDHLGFLRSSDEYKVMALASYGQPAYRDRFERWIRVDGGTYRVTRADLVAELGPRRARGAPVEQHHLDIAASLQSVLEDTALELARWLREKSGARHLVMAGGVALNCVMNARLRDSGLFDSVWVQPAAGDAGTALGAALVIDRRERGDPPRDWHMQHAYYGPGYTDQTIEDALRWAKVRYRRLDDIGEDTAALLAADKLIGWFQGRMEFGPRALGARSILASPLDAGMQARLNELKDREDFRPVAPVVTEEAFGEFFESAGANGGTAPFMLFIHDVKPAAADRIPAVRHVDGTARVQTIRAAQNPRYHAAIEAFGRRTGVPVLVNTSFNTRGEPIVCTPRDALESFWTTPLDALVIGHFLVEKP